MAKTLNLTDKQTAALDKLTSAGIDARWWGRGDQGERIYLNGHGRRDVKVWIEFDDPAEVYGAALKVRIDDCGQHPNWYASQRAKFMADYADAFQMVTGQAEAEADTAAVTEAQAEAMQVGAEVTFYFGGAPGDSNPERSTTGRVVKVYRDTTAQIGQDSSVTVELDNGYRFYGWRGVMRFGGGAEVVRSRSIARDAR